MTFYETVRAAVADLAEHGFDSEERVARWATAIRAAAVAGMVPEDVLEDQLRRTFRAIYRREVERGGILRQHPGLPRFTLQQVAPRLHAELERRLAVSRNLIVLNRAAAMDATERRFRGWASSVPAGGSGNTKRTEESATIRRSLSSLTFVERRVAIDQGHKFAASLSATLAEGGGAIAATWHSHWRQANYDYREDHKERDGRVYLVRGNWAQERGLVKPGGDGYLDEITQPGEEVYCRCFVAYIYNLRSLPADMLTERGRSELARVRRELAA